MVFIARIVNFFEKHHSAVLLITALFLQWIAYNKSDSWGWCSIGALGFLLRWFATSAVSWRQVASLTIGALGITLIPIMSAVYMLLVGSWWQRLLALLLPTIISVAAISTVGWLFFVRAHAYTQRGTVVRYGTTAICLWGYYCMILHAALLPFGLVAGYPFAHPLLPLAAQPPFLVGLRFLGTDCFLLGVLLVISLVMAVEFAAIRWLALGAIIAGWYLVPLPQEPRPAWLDRCVVLPQKFLPNNDCRAHLAMLHVLIRRIKNKQPQISTIFLPESAFADHHSLAVPVLQKELQKLLAQYEVTLCAGSFRVDGPYYRNTVYAITGSSCTWYDKQHTVPLVESSVDPACTARPVWSIAQSFDCMPYICSEFFIAQRDTYPGMIVAFCNDAWAWPSTQRLMVLAARYQARALARDVLYIGYAHHLFLTAAGNILPLQYQVHSVPA